MSRWIFVLLFLVSGCASTPQVDAQQDLAFDWPVPVSQTAAASTPGSLYQPGAPFAGLYQDARALAPGDLVTILINEQISASKSADTELERSSERQAGLSGLGGALTRLQQSNPNLNLSQLFNYDSSSAYNGSGRTSRSGEMVGVLTAVVTGYLPGGSLQIVGEKRIKVNDEEQLVRITGAIRPRDVDSRNRISSDAVALARIEYSGQGVVTDQQRPGWLTRVLDKIWPF
ncbi:MAG: flagellar biosynthesis protein FlgH [Candidatus Dadabacteria bacterium]|nr:MAG: flagellar biosynthesis protein FlgH [Candidatus Dadabacteria bacterium]